MFHKYQREPTDATNISQYKENIYNRVKKETLPHKPLHVYPLLMQRLEHRHLKIRFIQGSFKGLKYSVPVSLILRPGLQINFRSDRNVWLLVILKPRKGAGIS